MLLSMLHLSTFRVWMSVGLCSYSNTFQLMRRPSISISMATLYIAFLISALARYFMSSMASNSFLKSSSEVTCFSYSTSSSSSSSMILTFLKTTTLSANLMSASLMLARHSRNSPFTSELSGSNSMQNLLVVCCAELLEILISFEVVLEGEVGLGTSVVGFGVVWLKFDGWITIRNALRVLL